MGHLVWEFEHREELTRQEEDDRISHTSTISKILSENNYDRNLQEEESVGFRLAIMKILLDNDLG